MSYEKQVHRHRVSKFRVKIKSLAEESRIIRREERRNEDWVQGSLYLHRVGVVRDEQRHTLLAYAFLRGKSYRSVEQSCRELPVASKIERILKSLASDARKPKRGGVVAS